jgi:hypothetical protein
MQNGKVTASVPFPWLITVDGDFLARGLMDEQLDILHLSQEIVVNEKLAMVFEINDLAGLGERGSAFETSE